MADGMIPAVDASRPNGPRVYDFLLGGRDNYAADRDLAGQLEALADGGVSVRGLARVNRLFVLKAAGWAASEGIGQFLDLGCGGAVPGPSVHEAARERRDGARVVYVDRDPVAHCHVAALQAGPGLGAVLADAADPPSVLRSEPVRELIDLTCPVCIIFGGTLSGMDAALARATVASYAAELAPGSCMVISCASYADEETGARMAALYSQAGEWRNHSLADVTSFFGAAGMPVVHGRVMDLSCWPACPVTGPQGQPGARMLGGIGVRD